MGTPTIFNESMDKEIYEEMDIAKYVGDTKYKERNNTSNLRVYFDLVKFSVTEELKIKSEISTDASIQFQVQQQFQSSAF